MAAGNIADRHAGLHRLGNHGQLQIGGETPPASDAGDHFDLRERVGHRRIPRLIPRPSGYCRCPVETGCSSQALEGQATPPAKKLLMPAEWPTGTSRLGACCIPRCYRTSRSTGGYSALRLSPEVPEMLIAPTN